MALAAWDAALKKRTLIGWVAFRIVAGALVALGMICWVGLWFQRNFWLGVIQAILCGGVLAQELGILGTGDRGTE